MFKLAVALNTKVEFNNSKQQNYIFLQSNMKHPCTKCSHLGVTFNKKWKLEKHRREVHQEETGYRFHCNTCDFQTDNRKNFLHHQQEQHNITTTRKSPIKPPTTDQENITIDRNHPDPSLNTLPNTLQIAPPLRTYNKTPVNAGPTPNKKRKILEQQYSRPVTSRPHLLPTPTPGPRTTTNTINFNTALPIINQDQDNNRDSNSSYSFTCNIQLQMRVTVDRETGRVAMTLDGSSIQPTSNRR